MKIKIEGQPPRTTHQSGTRYSKRRTYKTQALMEAENFFWEGLIEFVPDDPIVKAVKLTCLWKFKSSEKKKIGSWKKTRPDTDNLQKTLKDVMTHLGFWKDDSLVAYEICQKIWSDDPGIEIEITVLEDV